MHKHHTLASYGSNETIFSSNRNGIHCAHKMHRTRLVPHSIQSKTVHFHLRPLHDGYTGFPTFTVRCC